ncbi:hypothetical protein CKO28_20645 [Rhodovibrio sodomensis]|uniref:Transmembrane protein PGPGW n=1 Tax=Rhodovibrio sodomensis TaxID=1088 RepID=A0ABS1DIY5_9PROT|nr:hypothetical protein [Rhodovibrio sodomensis]MBK1670437.1 hypothetical protein [Rhodovibrio sodomensis]
MARSDPPPAEPQGRDAPPSRSARPRKPRPLARRLAALGATALLIAGLAVFVTPLPLGGLMVGLALVVLVRVSPTARLVRRSLTRRYPHTARRLDATRRRIAARLRR